jgi:fucose permease
VIVTGAGFILSSFASGWARARLGTRHLAIAAAALLSAGLLAFALAPTWPLCLAASVLSGAGGGLLDAGLTAHVALHHGLRAMNALHAAWGVGATIGPLLLTAALATPASWRGGYVALALLNAGLAALLWLPTTSAPRPAAEAVGPAASPRVSPALLLLLALFFLYVGVEGGAGTWAYSFLVGSGLPTFSAGLLVSGYWAALTAGRALLAVAGGRVRAGRLLDLSLLVAVSAAALLAAGLAPALLLIGLGLAGVYPALMTLTPERLGRGQASYAVGYQTAAGNLGGTLLPAAAGPVLQAGGLSLLPWLLLAGGLALAGLHLASRGAREP